MTTLLDKGEQIIYRLDVSEIRRDRLEQLIDVMERVVDQDRAFTITRWQDTKMRLKNETDLHECGSAACLAGWLGVSPEFQAAGGTVDFSGCPTIRYDVFDHNGGDAIFAFLLGKTIDDDVRWCPHIGTYLANEEEGLYPARDETTAEHVLAKLRYIRHVVIDKKLA